ncbi:hypothetical protein HELRODRAFT_75645 [Helobdella robusta]|uniref:5'-Nucleotidase C-terminal domain-containing protein n=1 Tax=Helobdella robusta TaxID=6412 RepID=T1G282_HELRO|nr:hypothetical protein HELRODRAFT_75645 [Helobdella robusta]ESO08195.1 hypothetical protein HELRODRAFT_75645 [Helobdella robusta]
MLNIDLISVAVASNSGSGSGDGDSFTLHLLHTNDVHSRFEPFTSRNTKCNPEELDNCFGGVARRAGFINMMKKELGEIMLLDAGDQFQGTPWFYFYKGHDSSHFLNELKYQAMALGNHEFDNGVEGLRMFLGNVTVPILCSNLDLTTAPDFMKKVNERIEITYKNHKFDVVGYITDTVVELSKTEDLKFSNELEKVKEVVTDLVRKGSKFIIALGHAGYEADKRMAREIPDIDIIVGGHSHTLLYHGSSAGVEGDYPTVVRHADGRRTLIVQAGTAGKWVGVLNVAFDEEGNVKSWSGNPVLMNLSIPEDPAIAAQIEYLNGNLSSMFKKVLGRTDVFLDANDKICRSQECNIGNLFTDAMVSFFKERNANATIAFINGGGLRGSMERGDITYTDVITTFPFTDVIMVAETSGRALLEALRYSISDFNPNKEKHGKFLQVSGLKVVYNAENENNTFVVSAKVRPDYEDIRPNATYRIITGKFLLAGGDGYTMFKGNDTRILEFGSWNFFSVSVSVN